MRERGFTLMELLVGLGLGSLLMAAAIGQFLESSYRFHNSEVRSETEQIAESILDLMVSEFRLLGNGIPFTQADFQIGTAGLGDAPLPILLTSDADSITFRSNLDGDISVLTADYQPSGSLLTFTAYPSGGYALGDSIYLSALTVHGSSGLYGEITSLSGDQFTIDASYIGSASADFPAGSVVQPVETITYESPGSWTGITRTVSLSSVTLSENTQFSLRYIDKSGGEIAVPLSESDVATSLAAIELTVYVRSLSPLKDGSTYTAERTQRVALRNLQYL